MTTTNVPSDQFADLKRDIEDATRYSNNLTPFINRVGKQIRPIPLQEQDVVDTLAAAEQALANSGFIPKGDFSAGGVVEAKNEIFSDGSDYWRYDGALPFTVAAGSSPTPTGVGAWINVSDGALRSQLAAVDSTVLVGGIEAGFVNAQFKTLRPVAGETDFMPRLAAALSVFDAVFCEGEFPIASVFGSIMQNKKIVGNRGNTVFNISPSLTTGDVFDLGTESSIEGVSILGGEAIDSEDDNAWFNSVDDAVNASGAGTLNAVRLREQSSKLIDTEIVGFSGWAVVTNKNNVSTNGKGVDTNVTGCRIYANYGGIGIPEESEYMKFNNNSITWNVIGVRKAGGNNTFTGNNIDHNRVNFITKSGLNNSHGAITGGTMNHGKLAILIAYEITVSDAITGVNMFDGGDFGVYIKDSIGLNIRGCSFSRCNLYCSGSGTVAGNPGTNLIVGNTFGLHGATYQTYRNWNHANQSVDESQPDNCVLRDNYNAEGQASRDGSGWDESDLNDETAPDSDGFTQHQTLLASEGADTNSRIVSGRPLDGSQYLGNGNKSGAIKIKLPVASFNNSNIRMKISIRTSNRLGSYFDFNSFIASGGSWANTVMYSHGGTPYKLRFGRDVDGKPVVYIGELNSTFTSSMVEVEFFSMHAGVFTESKNWKRGWEITQETSAFSNVTQERLSAITGFTGDLNDIDYDSEMFVSSGSTSNTPISSDGWCKTRVRNEGAGIRIQTYTTTSGALYTRATTGGGASYPAWVEK